MSRLISTGILSLLHCIIVVHVNKDGDTHYGQEQSRVSIQTTEQGTEWCKLLLLRPFVATVVLVVGCGRWVTGTGSVDTVEFSIFE